MRHLVPARGGQVGPVELTDVASRGRRDESQRCLALRRVVLQEPVARQVLAGQPAVADAEQPEGEPSEGVSTESPRHVRLLGDVRDPERGRRHEVHVKVVEMRLEKQRREKVHLGQRVRQQLPARAVR